MFDLHIPAKEIITWNPPLYNLYFVGWWIMARGSISWWWVAFKKNMKTNLYWGQPNSFGGPKNYLIPYFEGPIGG